MQSIGWGSSLHAAKSSVTLVTKPELSRNPCKVKAYLFESENKIKILRQTLIFKDIKYLRTVKNKMLQLFIHTENKLSVHRLGGE